MLKTSTGELQSCCDMNSTMIDMLKVSTGYLQSQIDAIETSTETQSIIDNLASMIGHDKK